MRAENTEENRARTREKRRRNRVFCGVKKKLKTIATKETLICTRKTRLFEGQLQAHAAVFSVCNKSEEAWLPSSAIMEKKMNNFGGCSKHILEGFVK